VIAYKEYFQTLRSGAKEKAHFKTRAAFKQVLPQATDRDS
jgi:hypothetical protein